MTPKYKVLYWIIPLLIMVGLFLLWPSLTAGSTKESLVLGEEAPPIEIEPQYQPYLINNNQSLRERYKDTSFKQSYREPTFQEKNQTLGTLTIEDNVSSFTGVTRYGLLFVSLEEMSVILDYTYGETKDPKELLLKNDYIMGLFHEDQRNHLLEVHQKECFQMNYALEAKPFKDESLGFMVPLKNLLMLMGYDDISVIKNKVTASKVEDSTLALLDSFIQNDLLIQSNYFNELDQIQIPSKASFILLGDMSFGTNYGRKNPFDEIWQKEGGGYFLRELQPYFNNSDLVITNLENVFTDRDAYQKGKIYTYKAHRVEYLDVLREGGITHVNIVNNHMVDYLQEGFDDTLTHLKDYDIPYFGTNLSKTDNIEIGNIKVDEYQVFEKGELKIGLVGYLGFNSSYVADDKIQKDIKMLRESENVDYIVAAMHWGGQNTHEVTWKQKEMGRKLVDFGVDLVYGNHPHVLQEVEIYKGKPIYYSLGNFLFTDYKSAKDPDGIMIKVDVLKDFSGNLTETFTHTPILWSGHPSKNTYQPIVTTDVNLIKRTLDKLKVFTKEPISFKKD